MRLRSCWIMLVCLPACGGCGQNKSTDDLIADLQSAQERQRLIAVRLLPQRAGEAAKIVPALIDSLKDKQGDIRWSAAIGLGNFGEEARDAILALQTAQHDGDVRVREAAGVALARIDPTRFSAPSRGRPAGGK